MNDLAQQRFYKDLGARIRQLRGGRFTQEQLAIEVGLKRTSLVNIEAGEQKLLVHHLLKIAKTLGVRAADITAPLEHDRDAPVVVENQNPNVGRWMNRAISKAIQTAQP